MANDLDAGMNFYPNCTAFRPLELLCFSLTLNGKYPNFYLFLSFFPFFSTEDLEGISLLSWWPVSVLPGSVENVFWCLFLPRNSVWQQTSQLIYLCLSFLPLEMMQTGLDKSLEGHLMAYVKCFVWKGLFNSSSSQIGAVVIQSIRVNNTSWNNVLFPECDFKEWVMRWWCCCYGYRSIFKVGNALNTIMKIK